MLEQALDADVSDLLLLPQLTHNVVFAIRKPPTCGGRRRRPPGRTGRVLTVFSLRRVGTGKTVVATNLAAALVKREGRRTLLLDSRPAVRRRRNSGSGSSREKTIYDLVVAPGELDSEKLAGYVTQHASGLDVLPAPLRPEDAELVTKARLTSLIEVARGSYEFIVVDTSPFFSRPMLATLDRTDELFVFAASTCRH